MSLSIAAAILGPTAENIVPKTPLIAGPTTGIAAVAALTPCNVPTVAFAAVDASYVFPSLSLATVVKPAPIPAATPDNTPEATFEAIAKPFPGFAAP